MSRLYKERRLYFFLCAKCGHRAQSFKRRRARGELCRLCRRPTNENQQSLFEIPRTERDGLAPLYNHEPLGVPFKFV